MKVLIVGNSKSLLGKGKGPEIDSYDRVIRLNAGYPEKERADDLGTKITGWSASAINPQWTQWRNKFPKEIDVYYLNMRLYDKAEDILPLVSYQNNPIEYQSFIKQFGYRRPSTGLITVEYLARVFKDISVIGFDFFTSGTWYRQSDKNGPHDGMMEKSYMQNLGVTIL